MALHRGLHHPTQTDVTLVCAGELDPARWRDLRQEIVDCGAVPGTRRVVLDLGDVTFFDSSSVRALIGARQALVSANVTIDVVRASPLVTRVLEITGLDAFLLPSHHGEADLDSASAG